MKKILWTCWLLVCAKISFAQKQPLTLDALKNWPQIRNEKISADGKIVMYRIDMPSGPDTLVVRSAGQRWRENFIDVASPEFTANSRWFIYKKRDSVIMYDLKQYKRVQGPVGITSFKIPATGNGEWLACLAGTNLLLYNLGKNTTIQYDSVKHYQFSDNGKVLLLQGAHTLQWVDLKTSQVVTLMRGNAGLKNFVFDDTAQQLAFLADEIADGQIFTTLRYYRKGMDSAVVKVDKNTPGLNSPSRIPAAGIRFAPDGRRIFFPLRKMPAAPVKALAAAADVNIWHYNDDYLPTEQVANLAFDSSRTYTAVLHIANNKVVQIDNDADERYVDLAGDHALVRQNMNYFAGKWKGSTNPSFYVVDITDGRRTKIISQRDVTIAISTTGKYIVWYDPVKQSWFSHNTATGLQQEITPTLAGTLTASQAQRLQATLPFGIAGWLPDDQALLIYDEYDIWKIDPLGKKAPVNITNGYGKKHGLMLRIWNTDNNDYSSPLIHNSALLLAAFDTQNKNNGFFKTTTTGDPVQLTLDPYLYYAHHRFNTQFLTKYPMAKAAGAEAYIVRRMNGHEYPNLYYTKDLKQFTPLSDLQPQKAFNWFTNELISWQQPDGKTAQGILYKPENFDPSKKYPVIFYFYEKLSYRLHQFLHPELSRGSIDIPWYVSNGYVVVTPDITYTAGNPGESALNAVSTCANFIQRMPWADPMRMGLQGHSFGGYQVNYIVSHTNLFAAAQESAGAADLISYYNGFYREHSAQFYFESGQGRLGYTLWEKPELYTNNSPIFRAHEVKTPLLIMHNKEDGEVPFQQGMEWFTALRRLGKKVWMLQYDREHHGIDQPKNQRDFTIRMAQFFDHYLKGAPAPAWMVSGLPARLKGKETGMELTAPAIDGRP